jgi:hypothetical protein
MWVVQEGISNQITMQIHSTAKAHTIGIHSSTHSGPKDEMNNQ